MFKKVLPLIVLFALLLSACASPAQAPAFSQGERSDDQYASGAPSPGDTTQKYDTNTANIPQVDRLVIKNASLTIVVDDPAQISQKIGGMAEEMGGYVVTANLYQTYNTNGKQIPHASVTIRVPAENLNDALAGIKLHTTEEIVRENISSQDVTGEYTDLQSRLRNAEAAEAELTRIMQSASETEDVLNVYAQLKAVREEIELLKGQMQYYEQSAAYSLISVELMATESIQPIEIGGWKPQGVARDAIQALVYALQFLANAAIWIILFCAPVMLIFGIPLVIIVIGIRTLTRRTRKQITPLPATPHDAPVA